LGQTNAVNAGLVVFTLNRYALEGRVDTSIIIPETLDMRAVSQEEDQVYRLVAVVRHDGGHYTADVHHSEGNVWIRTDDSGVAPLAEPDMMGPQPFVLLYEAI
jgi:ubiquitin C-terminal hydrolase